MLTPEEWLKKIAAKEEENRDLYSRMDKDRDYAFAKSYTLKDHKGRRVPEVYNVTLPEAKNFLEKCKNKLMAIQTQTLVEGDKMSDVQTTRIEEFLNDFDIQADELLTAMGEPDADAIHSYNVCLRGPIAEQIVCRVEDGVFIPDCRPLDTRFMTYELGNKGTVWAAPKTNRLVVDIEDEYGLTLKSKEDVAEVIDLWTPEKEMVWADGELIKDQINPYGYVPFVIAHPATGTFIKDKDSAKYRNESIFALVRNDEGVSLFDELNFLASIMKTLNVGLIKPALQYESTDGETAVVEEHPGTTGSVTSVEKGGGFKLVPQRDIANYTRYYKNMVDTLKQVATFAITDYGSISFPLSAVAMSKLSSERNEALLPRLNARAVLKQKRAKMIIRQAIALGSVEIGEEGHRRKYTASDLAGEYNVKYRYTASTKEDTASDAALASSLRGIYSEDTIRRDILKMSDPDGETAKIQIEELRRKDEIVDGYLTCHELVDRAKVDPKWNTVAWITLNNTLNLIERRKQNLNVPLANEPNTKAPTANANPLMPLFSNGGGQSMAPQEGISAE